MEFVKMSQKEIYRDQVLKELERGNLSRSEASKRLGLSLRQLDRIRAVYRRDGVKGLIHGNGGKWSNNAFSSEYSESIIDIVREHYADFKPGLCPILR